MRFRPLPAENVFLSSGGFPGLRFGVRLLECQFCCLDSLARGPRFEPRCDRFCPCRHARVLSLSRVSGRPLRTGKPRFRPPRLCGNGSLYSKLLSNRNDSQHTLYSIYLYIIIFTSSRWEWLFDVAVSVSDWRSRGPRLEPRKCSF